MAEARASAGASLATPPLRDDDLVDQALTRAAGAPLVAGNRVRLLKDGTENYPAWLDAIRGATRTIHFENYIFYEDEVGMQFAEALASRAREGLRVRLLQDWMGGLGKASRAFWRNLVKAGVEVRFFNPPRISNPFDWLHRDHRKLLSVDGSRAFVTGLCVGRLWAGDAARGVEPWRDTGIEIRGPAVRMVELAFAHVWALAGAPLPENELQFASNVPKAGDTAVRIVANSPGTAALLRIDQLVAAAARERLWLTDAYFAGIAPYVQALRSAALDGVDVRMLVPGASDMMILRPLSLAGYRPLLEAGVRLFEWQGPMLHAKTAVADGGWARVGSSNLNLASWIGNYELDAVVEDTAFAAEMEKMFLTDLERCTEIVLHPRQRRHAMQAWREMRAARRQAPPARPLERGSAGRAAAGALRLGRTVGAAFSKERMLGSTEAKIVAVLGIAALALSAMALVWPLIVAVPFAVLGSWTAAGLLARAYALRRERRALGLPPTRVTRRQQAQVDTPEAEARRQ
jgi:cardiolipin synthase